MTSPTQLKYLEAMGIPVWVSRDLVSFKDLDQIDDTNNFDNKSTVSSQENRATHSKLDSNSNAIPSSRSGSNSNSAQGLINSLDSSPAIKTSLNNKDSITDAVTNTVSKAQIPVSKGNNQTLQASSSNLLFKLTQHYVFASGSETADWMVIGHSPESYNGIGNEPFAGESGILLDNMLRAVGVESPRQDAYLLNIFDHSTSSKDSISKESITELNSKIIALIDKNKPKVVLIVGQIAAQNLLNSTDPLIIMRSKAHQLSSLNIPCVVTYYPSYLLQKTLDKRKAWDDLKLAMAQL